VLNQFNYERGENLGVELSAQYSSGNFTAYGNLAWARQAATNIVSNQYLFGADELAYIASHWVYTDHAQSWTSSLGASYLWRDTKFSANVVYGSGMRSGDFNTDHVAQYATANLGVSREIKIPRRKTDDGALRCGESARHWSICLRDGSGIGVFAPQYGMRRGFFMGVSQKI